MRKCNGRLEKHSQIASGFMRQWWPLRARLLYNHWNICEVEEYEVVYKAIHSCGSVAGAQLEIERFSKSRGLEAKIRVGRLLDEWRREGQVLGVDIQFPSMHFSKTIYKVMRDEVDTEIRDWVMETFLEDWEGSFHAFDLDVMSNALNNRSLDYVGTYRQRKHEMSKDIGEVANFIRFGMKTNEDIQNYFVEETGKAQAKIETAHDILKEEAAEDYGNKRVDELHDKQRRLSMVFAMTQEINYN